MVNFQKISSKSVPLNRGVNENKSALELGHSELTACSNYELSDGTYAGLTSINGYEVYDGTPLASETEVLFHDSGLMILTGDELEGGGTATEDGDTDRLAARDLIVAPAGDGPILSVFEYKSHLWCIRDDSSQHKIHWSALDGSEATGWPNTPIEIPGATVTPNNPTGIYKVVIGRFSHFHGNAEVAVLTNGLTTAYVLYMDEDGANTLSAINSEFLPSAEGKNDSDTVLLIHPDSTEDSTTFIDTSDGGTTHSVAAVGGAINKKDEVVFGTTSIELIADGDHLNIPASADFVFGTGDFTIDWWEYVKEKNDNSSAYCAAQDFRVNLGSQETDARKAYLSSDGTTWDILNGVAMGAVTYDAWEHLAIVREGDEIRAYLNGEEQSSTTSALAIFDNGDDIQLGQSDSGESIRGYLEEIRVSKGVARWSENFTPDTVPYTSPVYPYICEVWNERLILGYPDGQVFFHQPGSDPTNSDNWDAAIASSGVINLEDTVTNFLVAPSACFLFCEGMIKFMSQLSFLDESTGVDFTVKTFSPTSGAKWDTVRRVLGTIMFCDDRGISTLETTEAFGDFNASVVSRNIQRTYSRHSDEIVGAYVDREKNQYRVFHSVDGGVSTGYTVTLSAEDSSLKGVTGFTYPIRFTTVFEDKWFGGADGFVYKNWDGAESFNCNGITGTFITSFGNYGNPTSFKSFKKLLIEYSSSRGTEINVRCLYDYNSIETPKGFVDWIDTSQIATAAPWGTEEWSSFRWSSESEGREHMYLYGIGSNMAVTVGSNDAYHAPHTIHNFITQYSLRAIDF